MGIRTEQQYWKSIRKQKPEVHIMGERVEEIIDHPLIKGSANGAALTVRYANDPQYRDLFTIHSPLVNEPVNRYVSVHNNIQDLMEKVKLIRFVAQKTGECAQRCMGWDALNAVYSTTYETDQKHETPYHSRFKDYLTWVQKKDIMVHGTMTDPRGDRSLKPAQQKTPTSISGSWRDGKTELWSGGQRATRAEF